MSEINKTYRIRTDIGQKTSNDFITIDTNLLQDYETFDILSVKIESSDTYKLHNANYGVVVGRVLANNGFGIPNAKISIFIQSDSEDGDKIRELYPYTSTASKNSEGIRYNLLPDEKVNDCHAVVGTFPNKRYALDNDVILENIIADGYVKNTKLFRRFVMAQMFQMLNYVSYDGRNRGYNDYLRTRYGYDYTLKMMLEEVRVLSKQETRKLSWKENTSLTDRLLPQCLRIILMSLRSM